MAKWKKVVLATGTSTQYIKGDGTFATFTDSLPLTGGTVTGDVTMQSSSADSPILTIKNTHDGNGSPRLYFEHDSNSPADNDEIGQIRFYANNDAGVSHIYAMLRASATDVTATGNTEDGKMEFFTAKAGAETTLTLVLESGVVELPEGQLKFPATQNASSDANTLDDYQEGTWTPTFVSASGHAPTITGTLVNDWTKIGNTITISLYITFGNDGGGTDQVQISGLPYALSANVYFVVPASVRRTNFTSNIDQYGLAITNTDDIAFYYTDANGDRANLTYSDIDTSSNNIMFTFTYLDI